MTDIPDLIERLEEMRPDFIAESSAIMKEAAQALRDLQAKINAAVNVGHNDDCMFCGFKDKALTTDVVKEQALAKALEEL